MAEGTRTTVNTTEIEALLRDVGAYQLEGYRSLSSADIDVKDDTSHGYSVVTEYDVETERRVFEYVSKNFPEDSFLGEENGNIVKNPDRYWILDPIDGTSNFTQGVPFWGPSFAEWDADGPVRGWIYFPALDQLFTAERGGGAFLNGRPIKSSRVSEYSNLCSVGTVSRLHREFRLRNPAKHRILGSIIVNLCYVASGTFAATYSVGCIWDLAAGLLIAREAGAVIETDPDYTTLDMTKMNPLEKGSSPSISTYAMANDSLHSLRKDIEPIADPITAK